MIEAILLVAALTSSQPLDVKQWLEGCPDIERLTVEVRSPSRRDFWRVKWQGQNFAVRKTATLAELDMPVRDPRKVVAAGRCDTNWWYISPAENAVELIAWHGPDTEVPAMMHAQANSVRGAAFNMCLCWGVWGMPDGGLKWDGDEAIIPEPGQLRSAAASSARMEFPPHSMDRLVLIRQGGRITGMERTLPGERRRGWLHSFDYSTTFHGLPGRMIMQFHSGGSDGQVHAHSTRMEIVIQELRFATRRLQWNDLRWEAIAPLEVAQTPTKFVGANLWVKSDVDWHQVQPERRGLFTGPRAKTRLAWVYRCTALLVAILSAFAMAHAIKHKSTKERNHYGG